MEESVKKERQNVVEITETYEHLKRKAGEQEKEIHLLEDASRRNVEMEHSLQDIAQLVEDEVDEVDLAIETNHSPALVKFSSFEWVNISITYLFFHILTGYYFTNLTFPTQKDPKSFFHILALVIY